MNGLGGPIPFVSRADLDFYGEFSGLYAAGGRVFDKCKYDENQKLKSYSVMFELLSSL